jgi:hypothetical protein
LANFSGEIAFTNVPVAVDRTHNESYVAEADAIRVFNPSGMEIFQFFASPESGAIFDVAVDGKGSIFALSYVVPRPDVPGASEVTRFDERGRIREVVRPVGLPDSGQDFIATTLRWHDGDLHWLDAWRKLVVRTDSTGRVVETWDLGEIAGATTEDPPDAEGGLTGETPGAAGEINGFTIDGQGRFLFTIAVYFQAFRFDPKDGKVDIFGESGAGPGKFGLVGGIVTDDWGQIYVADRARNAVLIFDPTLRFVREFGNRGAAVARLVIPEKLAYGRGRLYVSQWVDRGISVFSVGEPEP